MSTDKLEQMHKQALALLDTNRLADAIKLYTQICAIDAKDAEARLMLGAINGELGHVDDAIANIRNAIALDPEYAEAYVTLGEIYQSRNELPGARECFEKAVEVDVEYPEAWMVLGAINGQLADHDAAVNCSRRAIALDPSLAQAHFNLANALSSQGNLADAAASYYEATRRQPNLAAAWPRYAAVLANLGMLDKAESASRRAIQLLPNDGGSYLTLAHALEGQGRLEEAASNCQTVLNLEPHSRNGWLLFSKICEQQGHFEEMAAFSQRAIEAHPNSAGAYWCLGEALARLDERQQAIEAYRHATTLEPDFAEAWLRCAEITGATDMLDEADACFRKLIELQFETAKSYSRLGTILRLKGEFEEAESCCKEALRLDPQLAEAHAQLGQILEAQGKFEESLNALGKALELDPENLDAIGCKAEIHDKAGDIEKSYELLLPLVEAEQFDYRIARIYGRLSRHYGHHEKAISMIEELISHGGLGKVAARELHFLAGRLYDQTGRAEAAFSHIQSGSELMDVNFDPAKHHKYIDQLIDVFDSGSFSEMPRASNRSELPVFIVGMPRSGTSLIEQILSSHPSVWGAGELGEISTAAASIPSRLKTDLPFPLCMRQITRDVLDDIAEHHLAHLATLANGALRVTDKMPHNFLWLGLIELLFPNARIIRTVRNPLDTCLSCYFQNFAGDLSFCYSLEHLGLYYNDYQRLMQHWKDVLTLPLLEVEYETLIKNPLEISQTIVRFCGLEWDERCLRFHESKRFVRTASYDQVRQPIYAKAVGRWKQYDRFLEPLKRVIYVD